MIQLTEKQFEIFKEECQRWIQLFGLKDWEIFFRFEEPKERNRGRCPMNMQGKDIHLVRSPWHSEERSEGEISKCAFHEVC